MNLAARLVDAAQPSSALVSQSIFEARASESDLRFDAPELLAVKGIAQPVRVASIDTKTEA